MTFLCQLMKDVSAEPSEIDAKLESFSKVLFVGLWKANQQFELHQPLSPPQLQPASSYSLITHHLMQIIGIGKCCWTSYSSPHIKGVLGWACSRYYF